MTSYDGFAEVSGPPSLSEDGAHAAWLAGGESGAALVLFDVARGELERRRVEAARCRGFTWSRRPGIGLAVADRTGDENDVLYRVDVRSGEWTPLGPPSSRTSVAGLSGRRPEDVLVTTTARAAGDRDYHVVSLRTGERSLVLESHGYGAVYFDELFRPRLFETLNPDGSRDLWHGDRSRGELFLHIPHDDALGTRLLRFSEDGRTVFFELPAGAAATSLAAIPCVEGRRAGDADLLYQAARAGIADVFFSADRGLPEIVQVERGRTHCVPLTAELDGPVRSLRRLLRTEPVLVERRLGDRRWLVATSAPHAEPTYFVFEPAGERLWRLSTARPRRRQPLAARHVRVPLRDGNRAPTYVTGAGSGEQPPPAALLVHGGPWRRSRWSFDERRAWLVAQGLTVVEPNFRGSTGFGSAWITAGDHEWGRAMQDDLVDALEWSIERGLADPERLAFVGGSYGGYAVLQLAATGPLRPRCVLATSPLTDLVSFLEAPPAAWRTATPMLLRRVGDPGAPDERRRLEAVSPVHRAADLDSPVLLVHGATDSRVPVEMSTRMLMALARAGKDATLVVFPDEGHEIVQRANRQALWALAGRFLARHLGSPADPPAPPPETTARLFTTPAAHEPAVAGQR